MMADIVGSKSSETLIGTASNDVINALMDGGGGGDVLRGGAGDDRLMSDGGGDTIYGGAGIDTADLRLQNMASGVFIDIAAQLAATSNNLNALYDIGDGSVKLNSIERLFFYGGSGDDVVYGGNYNDRLDGGLGKDVLFGGAGDDQLFGHNGNLVLDAGTGNDVITVDGYVKTINGGEGVDKLYINGTAGFDAAGHVGNITNIEQVFVKAGLSPVTFSRDQAPQELAGKIYGLQISVSDVKVGSGYLGSTITGTEYNDIIKGGSGDDHLIGNKGDDVLLGGAGNDVLEGGIGSDRLYGDAGDDRFIVNSGPGQQPDVLIDGGVGTDTINFNAAFLTSGITLNFSTPSSAQSVNGATVVNVEILEFNGSNFADKVTGGDLDDKIDGGAGDDILKGGKGNDLIWGGVGVDTAVFSGNKEDYSVSHVGNKLIVVGADGTDSLWDVENLQFDNGSFSVSLFH